MGELIAAVVCVWAGASAAFVAESHGITWGIVFGFCGAMLATYIECRLTP